MEKCIASVRGVVDPNFQFHSWDSRLNLSMLPADHRSIDLSIPFLGFRPDVIENLARRYQVTFNSILGIRYGIVEPAAVEKFINLSIPFLGFVDEYRLASVAAG